MFVLASFFGVGNFSRVPDVSWLTASEWYTEKLVWSFTCSGVPLWWCGETWVYRFSTGLPSCLFSWFDQFLQKSLLWFFGYQLLGCPVQGKMGDSLTLHCIKKNSSSCFFVFLLFFFLNSNDNISSIIQMRKLLKSLKFLYWVSWQLPFILWSETDNFSWFVLCHHNGHFYREITSFNLLLSWLTWPIFSPQTGP